MQPLDLRFIDLFAGLGGFHLALRELGLKCVFASEINEELRRIYIANFPEMEGRVFGDIRNAEVKGLVPDHDVLCAGFPCQPFSKSGTQLGTQDETRGTLFHEICEILERRKPTFVILENVGNFGRHDHGRTWKIVHDRLTRLGYEVQGTEHRGPRPLGDWRDVGGKVGRRLKPKLRLLQANQHGLVSPHHFGFPHHRERFFIVASLWPLPYPAFPLADRRCKTSLKQVLQSQKELSRRELRESKLTEKQFRCIQHWNELLGSLPQHIELPSFPLWADELGAAYPFESGTPWSFTTQELRKAIKSKNAPKLRKKDLLRLLPSYAREETKQFRNWKIRFIRLNRQWWKLARPHIPKGWTRELRKFPASMRKLEWNAKGGSRDLWKYVLQFRPSGLRVKRPTSSPALIAMTATQIPIVGGKKRFLTRIEGLRLQGFPDDHELPASRERAFMALGNAVHVGVVERIAETLLASAKSAKRGHTPRVQDHGRLESSVCTHKGALSGYRR